MSDDLFMLPDRPFFSCDQTEFAVVDGALMHDAGNLANITPVLSLHVGPGNIFEQSPRRVLSRDGDVVAVECDGGVTVYLNFDALAVRAETPGGEFIYRGGLDEGNEGRGWMAAR